MVCLLAALLFLAFSCRKESRIWQPKQPSYKEEQNMPGPFSFQTGSTAWAADVKQAIPALVIMFEKPLLNLTFADQTAYRGFWPGGIHLAVRVLVHGSKLTDHKVSRELEYFGQIKHLNLVPLIGYCLAGDQRIAIYDYMENGSLQDLSPVTR
ncbi:hypothetical protein V6N13_066608 [Hibiscus sabdariffa]|uniref:Serine-threonine/tyrosine-protein kinase catalytic domain-containing protein n=1 Tax=Hibiscus sabdariffa TaxID=183260 RepID=A0ABR2DQZ3_9ROSI